ncbi:MAG: Asp-tRNA(Asn)/Glu-tRNA(Gln) amidotransferase subunit GatC [bacterium]
MTEESIKKIAWLCKLTLTDEEIAIYKGQFEKILKYIEQLDEVDVTGFDAYMTPVTNQLRTDEIRYDRLLEKQIALNNADKHDDNYVKVSVVSVK